MRFDAMRPPGQNRNRGPRPPSIRSFRGAISCFISKPDAPSKTVEAGTRDRADCEITILPGHAALQYRERMNPHDPRTRKRLVRGCPKRPGGNVYQPIDRTRRGFICLSLMAIGCIGFKASPHGTPDRQCRRRGCGDPRGRCLACRLRSGVSGTGPGFGRAGSPRRTRQHVAGWPGAVPRRRRSCDGAGLWDCPIRAWPRCRCGDPRQRMT